MSARRGFTLLEVLATLLLLAVGVTAIIGMVRYGTRVSSEAQIRTTALLTAGSVALDAEPGGLTADPSDGDGDGWMLTSGSLAAPPTGGYEFVTEGYLNGFYVQRIERSIPATIVAGEAPAFDDPTQRWASVTVDIYAADDGRYVTSTRQRLLRTTRAP